MRIGIFGGSFDPVHLGHLWIGEAATEQLQLDRLLWVPSATQPLKPAGPTAGDQQRLEMLRLAIAGRDGHQVDPREIQRSGVSYTLDTVTQLGDEYPAAELFLIIGSDSLESMPRWHQPKQLLSRVTLSVVQRGGQGEIDFQVLQGMVDRQRIDQFSAAVIQMPVIEISSRDIRSRVGQGRGIRYRVTRAVEAYIDAEGLYRSDDDHERVSAPSRRMERANHKRDP
ncbi:nicotinate (nicotinamide) nucleotide adenylyltransferase [Stieleria sp. TO1_6]|uniref:nicotinate (nicotinamide) nucleotide adenylyltransferase n=1 Tax=Stieleria tagensis TaxID=2956795 RepID=UPI00209B44A9|nr:nicotinate (nicotinamide) nucleotide adenylyltransferase [Stieleria tagensis]MCO8125279.1 nicotinate (nicotinamide) nucleotide adenylyltransferase [Stieleria tagensis]